MEGPLLVVKAWAFSLLAVWLYQRLFQRVGPRDPEFEAFLRTRPLLVAIDSRRSDLQRVRDAIVRLLAERRSAVAASGGWPWTIHALVLEVEIENERVLIHGTRASVLRTSEKPPTITDLLRAAAGASRTELDVWLHPGLHVDVTGSIRAPHGWDIQLCPQSDPKVARPVACERERATDLYSHPPDSEGRRSRRATTWVASSGPPDQEPHHQIVDEAAVG